MKKPNNYAGHQVSLILALICLLSGANSVLELAGRVSAHVVGPNWSITGSLHIARRYHTATLLPNGKVLVAGGDNGTGNAVKILNSAELYDPVTETWSVTASLSTPRRGHTATLLPNGKVLVVGGTTNGINTFTGAELYDPTTETWSVTASLNTARASHGATLLANGKVLVVGGTTNGINILTSAELYDPATETWSVTGHLNTAHYYHTTTLLPNGKVLIVGGSSSGTAANLLTNAELYDPATETWSVTASLNTARIAHTATLLPNGKVLVSAGWTYDLNTDTTPILTSAELYDPATGTWRGTGNLNTARADYAQTATLLANGKVLLAGGNSNSGGLNSAETYDPASGTWSMTGSLNVIREGHTATLMLNGKVLVVGGCNFTGNTANILYSAELFDLGLTQSTRVASVSAASFGLMGLASEAITSSFGTALATTAISATTLPLPTELAGTTVKVKDSAGIERFAPLFFVSPTQVNYQIPPGTAAGAASVTITSGDGTVSSGVALVNAVAPSLFAANANGQGVAVAVAVRVKADGSQSYEAVAQFDPAQNKFVARPLNFGPETDQVFLVLFGTGIRHRSSLFSVIATVGGAYAEVSFAGAQPDSVGLDQVNLLVPRSLAGRGEVEVLLTVEAQMANPVRVNLK